MSGAYRTPDFGVTWRLLDFSEIRGATQGCQVRFTTDPAVLYAIDYAFEEPAPAKSLDGGGTWSRLPSDPTGGGAYTVFADPSRTDRVLVSSYDTLYFSGDGGVTWNARYSDSGGLHLAGAFFDGNSICVGSSAGLLVSSNGGSSFGLASVGGIPADEAMVSFAGAKEGGTIRLLCVTLGSGDVYPGITGAEHVSYRGVYTLDWGQPDWVQRASGIASGDHPFFCGMSGGEADVLYVAGGSDDGVPVVYRSVNSGATWTKVLLTANNQNVATGWSGAGGDRDWSYGEYALGFAVSPVDPDRAVFTDLGFAHGTSDGGATWRQLYVHPSTENPLGASTPKRHYYRGVGLENTSCWWLTWSDASGIFASFTDIRGVRSMDGGVSWGFDYSGHTLNTMYHCVRHPNGTLYAATSSVHDLYQSTYLQDSRIDGGSGRVLYSTDGGATWQLLHDFAEPVVFLALDPNNPNRLYASVVHGLSADGKPRGGVWVSSNIQNGVASTWTKLADPPRTEGHPYTLCVLNDGSVVCSYSGRRNSSGTFTASSGVFILPSGATSWMDRSANPGMHYWTKDLVIDPHDASQNTWFACVFSGWGGAPNGLGGVYRTANRGQSWTRISALDRVESLVVNPASAAEAYVTTEIEGLWHTSNLTAGSPTFTRVESYLFQHPLRVFFNPHAADELWVTSFGYGMALGLIGAQRSPEVSGTTHPLRASRNGAGADVLFEESGADHYNLYVSNSPHTHPFRVASPQQGKRVCDLQGLTQAGGGYLMLSGFDLDSGITGVTDLLCFLVSADDGAGTEGPLGTDSLGQEITADSHCAW
jgi:photosystem II stability/assembly factor-like uncharacterized protein